MYLPPFRDATPAAPPDTGRERNASGVAIRGLLITTICIGNEHMRCT